MFTGIVEEMGVVKSVDRALGGTRLTILASTIMADLTVGSSVGVNGACLTVVEVADRDFAVDVSPETLAVTTFQQLAVGTPVNLERSVRLNERISGHLVSGHVDAVGVIRNRQQNGNAIVFTIDAPKEVLRYCVTKGSITVDGISLTINDVTDRAFTVAIIPYTARMTTLGLKNPGDGVNLESDLIGKYVERLLQDSGRVPPKAPPVIDPDYLKKRGLL